MPKTNQFSEAQIHPTVFIHERATVIGNVHIGEYSSIWPGAVLRADMNRFDIGKMVNIQDNSTLHSDSKRGISIGDYTLIGHHVMLHGCTIGRGVLVGINSIILDDALIGDGAMIMAGCMIRGGSKIPPRAMVVPKGDSIKIYENKARTVLTIAGCIEYRELAARCQKNIFKPFTVDEETEFLNEASKIFSTFPNTNDIRNST